MSTVDHGGSSAGPGSSSDNRTAHIIDFDLARCRKIISDLHYRLTRFSNSDRFYEEYELALYEYFEGRGVYGEEEDDLYDNFQSEEEFSRFLTWYSLYFVTDEYDKTFPELYLERRKNQLSALEREILQSYARSVLSVYEVQRVDPGKSIELRDIFTERVYLALDGAAARTLCKWDLIYGGLIEIRGYHVLSGMPLTVIPQKIKRFIEQNLFEIYHEERDDYRSFREYLKRASAEICALVENSVRSIDRPAVPGDPEEDMLSLTSVLFRVTDYGGFLKTVEKSPVFKAPEGWNPASSPPARVLRFTWLHKEGGKGSPGNSPGILYLKKDSLVVQCTSAKRAETLRTILEKQFGPILAYRTTIHKSVDRITLASAGESAEYPDGGAVCRDAVPKQFDNWIDEKIPSMGDMTPREAAKTPDGKRRLMELLKEFENQNEHALRRGIKGPDAIFFPVEKIRRELGL